MNAIRFSLHSLVAIFVSLAPAVPLRAQMYQCPPGSTQVGGYGAPGAYMCQCADGSYASIYGCPQSNQPQQQQFQCPAGSVPVSGGGGIMCQCADGSYASIYGCNVGDRCRNGGTCPVGTVCSQMPGRCVPVGKVDCGTYFCNPGSYCGSNNGCIQSGNVDCGNGVSCPSDYKCSRDGKKCLTKDAIDCGSFSCTNGQKCGSGNNCIAQDAIDCGHGQSCPAGTLCTKGEPWGIACLTREQLAERVAKEKRQTQELQRWNKETAETEKWLQQQLAEEKKAAEAKRVAEAREAARLKEEKRLQELAQKQATAVFTAMQKGRFHPNSRHWSKILKDQKQPVQMRQLAAAILGKELPNSANKKSTSTKEQNPAAAEASAVKPQPKTTSAVPGQCGRVSPCLPKMSFDACMQAEMNDPNECPAQRQIAAIALGKDPKSISTLPSPDQKEAAQSSTKPALSAALNPNLKNVQTLTPPTPTPPPKSLQAPAPSTQQCSTFGCSTGFAREASDVPADKPQQSDQTNAASKPNGLAGTVADIGKIGFDCLTAAGGAIKNVPTFMTDVGKVADYAAYGSAAYQTYQRDYVGAAQSIWNQVFVEEAGKSAAGPLGACVAQASSDIGQKYIAPLVAPYLGTMLFDLAPSIFMN